MEKEILKAKPCLCRCEKHNKASLHSLDLATFNGKMKYNPVSSKRKFNEVFSLKGTDKRVVQNLLTEGPEIKSYQLNDINSFSIIEKKLKSVPSGKIGTSDNGRIQTLHGKTKYSIIAMEKTGNLLTMANCILQLQ